MKVTSIILGALATIAAAAPAKVSEEKRNIGAQFGGGFNQFGAGIGGLDAFSLTSAFNFNPIVGFNNNVQGVLFGQDIVGGAFNNFVIQNSFIQYIIGVNQLSFDPLFSLFDAGLGVNNFGAIFQHPAGDFLNVQAILAIQQFADLSWIVNQLGAQAFLGGLGGFNGFNGFAPSFINFEGLAVAGLSQQSQFAINTGLIGNLDNFNNVITGFNGVGINQFQNFQFQKLQIGGGLGGFGGVSGFLKE